MKKFLFIFNLFLLSISDILAKPDNLTKASEYYNFFVTHKNKIPLMIALIIISIFIYHILKEEDIKEAKKQSIKLDQELEKEKKPQEIINPLSSIKNINKEKAEEENQDLINRAIECFKKISSQHIVKIEIKENIKDSPTPIENCIPFSDNENDLVKYESYNLAGIINLHTSDEANYNQKATVLYKSIEKNCSEQERKIHFDHLKEGMDFLNKTKIPSFQLSFQNLENSILKKVVDREEEQLN